MKAATHLRDLALALVDVDDQGTCPDGHQTELVSTPRGTIERVCYLAHDFDGGAIYSGPPLIAWGVTLEQIVEAEQAGVDSALIEWAYSTLHDRAPEIALYDGNHRVNVVIGGIDLDLILREDGTLYVSFAAVDRKLQAAIGQANIDRYRTAMPDLTVGLINRD